MAKKDVSTLRDEAAKAIERGKLPAAIALYQELEQRQPAEASWPKRIGEVHRRAGDTRSALAAFERAVDKYLAAGFLLQAVAVCKLILQIDPAHPTATARLAEHAPQRAPRAAAPAPTPDEAAEIVDRPPAARPSAPPPPPPRPTPASTAPLAATPLADVVPGALRLPTAHGEPSGIVLLPLDDDGELLDLDLEVVEEGAGELDAIERAIDLAEPAPPRPSARDSLEARRALRATPLLAALAPRALESLVWRLALVELAPGEVLFREGDAGDTLYVVTEGQVVVESAAAGELARMDAGAFVGEVALITDLPRSATIRAGDEPTALLAIDRAVMREVIGEHPAVLGVILRFVRDRLVERVTRTSELFRSFDPAERARLSARFELVEVDAGTPLIVQGQRADGLYVLLAGCVEVWRQGEPAAIAALGPGEVFGEISLLGGGGSVAHCRAATRVLALRMPVAVFQEVIMTHPQVLAYVGELADRRAGRPEVEGDFVDLHLDLI